MARTQKINLELIKPRTITKKELAIRWDCTEREIDKRRTLGIVTHLRDLPGVRFSLEEIELLERNGDKDKPPTHPAEVRKLKREMEAVIKERDDLKRCLRKILQESAKIIDFEKGGE